MNTEKLYKAALDSYGKGGQITEAEFKEITSEE